MPTSDDPRVQLTAEIAALRLRVKELEARGGAEQHLGADVRPDSDPHPVLDGIVDGIFGVDGQGLITFLNRPASELTGWPTDDVLGRPASDILDPEAERHVDPVASVLERGATEHFERFSIRHRAGGTVDVHLSISPLIADGRVAGAIATRHDRAKAQASPGRPLATLSSPR